MPLIGKIKKDLGKAMKMRRLPWSGVLTWMGVCGLIMWALVDLGRRDLALPTLNSVAVVGFTIALKRDLGRHVWFWITIGILAALHVPLVLFVPWTTKWFPALAIAAIDSADFIVMLAIIDLVGTFMGGAKST